MKVRTILAISTVITFAGIGATLAATDANSTPRAAQLVTPARFYACVTDAGDVRPDRIRVGTAPTCDPAEHVETWDAAASTPPSTTAAPTTTGVSSTTAPASTTTRPATTTTGTTAPPSAGGPLGLGGAWTLALGDEFNGTTLDRTKWNTFGSWECCNGGRYNPGNGELDYKTDGANFSFSGGVLTIQARRAAASCGGCGAQWTSGQLGSKQHFTYAFVEVRTQFPAPRGFLSALWTWGAPGTNAPQQEVDIYENYSDDHSDSYMTNHSSGGGGCGAVVHGFDGSTAMHVYGADIRANGIDWYIDGVKRCSTAGHPTQAWDVVYYMTVNAASRAPVADASTTHAEMLADWLRVWVRS